MPLTPAQQDLLADIADAEPGSTEEKNALQFIQENPINFEDEDFCWTPLITSIQYRRDKITQALLEKSADIHYVTKQGTTALATAIAVNDTRMIDFLHPKYKARWPKGEDRIVLERYVAYLDEYYPTAHMKSDEDIREIREKTIPLVNQCRTQLEPLSTDVIQAYETGVARLQRQLKEREENKERRKMVASLFTDEKQREAFIEKDKAASIARLDAENRLRKEKEALEFKLKEEQSRRLMLETKYEQVHTGLFTRQTQVEVKMEVVEKKMEVLWDEHEAEVEVKAQQQYIHAEEPLRIFYKGVRRGINQLFTGRMVASSGEVEVTDPTKLSSAIASAAGAIPLPGAGLVSKSLGFVVGLYQRYQKAKRDKRVDGGLTELAADTSELNESIVEPCSRALSLCGASQLRRFNTTQVATLADCAVRLMLIHIVYEAPSSASSYADLIQQLILAVRIKRIEGVKVKDIDGATLRPKMLTTLDRQVVSESQVFAAFESKIVSIRPQPSTLLMPAKSTPTAPIKTAPVLKTVGTPPPITPTVPSKTLPTVAKTYAPPPPPPPPPLPTVGVTSTVTGAKLPLHNVAEKKKTGIGLTLTALIKGKFTPTKTSTPMLPVTRPQPLSPSTLVSRVASPTPGLVLKTTTRPKTTVLQSSAVTVR